MGTEDVEARPWNQPRTVFRRRPRTSSASCAASDHSIFQCPSENPTTVTRGEGPPKRPEFRIRHRNSKSFSASLQLLAIADVFICSPPRDALKGEGGLLSTWPTRNEGLFFHLLPIRDRECLRSRRNQLLYLLAIPGKEWGIAPFLRLWRYRDQRQTPKAENLNYFRVSIETVDHSVQ